MNLKKAIIAFSIVVFLVPAISQAATVSNSFFAPVQNLLAAVGSVIDSILGAHNATPVTPAPIVITKQIAILQAQPDPVITATTLNTVAPTPAVLGASTFSPDYLQQQIDTINSKLQNLTVGSQRSLTDDQIRDLISGSVTHTASGMGNGLSSLVNSVSALTTQVNAITPTQWSTSGSNIYYNSGNVGIGTTSPWAKLSINPNGLTGPAFVIGSSTATNFIVTNAGNVGIGTSSPGAKLSVAGALLVDSGITVSSIYSTSSATSTINGSLRLPNTSSLSVGDLTLVQGFVFAAPTGNIATGYLSDSYGLPYAANSTIRALGLGGFAGGYAKIYSSFSLSDDSSNIVSEGRGTFAFGSVEGGLTSSAASSTLKSSGNGSIALGFAGNNKFILSSGVGSLAGGAANGGSISSTGYGSIAWGDNVSATSNYSFAFGKDFTNATFNTFQVGFSATPIFTITSSSLGIGTTSPFARLTIAQAADNSTGGVFIAATDRDSRAIYMDTSGVLHFLGAGSASTDATLTAGGTWTNGSDRVFKDNISNLTYGLNTVLQLTPRSYSMKANGEKQIGFIAQEVESIVPEVVSGEEGHKGIAYGNLTALTVSAIQDLSKILNIQTATGTPISMRLEAIEGRLNALEQKSLISQISEWVGNTVKATIGTFDQVNTHKLCVDEVCVTKEEFRSLLQKNGIGGTGIDSGRVIINDISEIEIEAATTTQEIVQSVQEIAQ